MIKSSPHPILPIVVGIILFYTCAFSEVIIEPFGTSVFVPEGDQEEAQMLLSNTGDTNIEFEIDFT